MPQCQVKTLHHCTPANTGERTKFSGWTRRCWAVETHLKIFSDDFKAKCLDQEHVSPNFGAEKWSWRLVTEGQCSVAKRCWRLQRRRKQKELTVFAEALNTKLLDHRNNLYLKGMAFVRLKNPNCGSEKQNKTSMNQWTYKFDISDTSHRNQYDRCLPLFVKFWCFMVW